MKPIKLLVRTHHNTYPIIIGPNIIKDLLKNLKKNKINFNQCLLVIDKKVPKNMINKIIRSLQIKKNLNTFLMQTKKIKIKKMLIKF